MSEHLQVNCAICGSPLIYLPESESMICHDCGREFRTDVRCEQGHYLCDSCHSHSANDFIEQQCLDNESIDPIELVVRIMKDRRVKMHGPEHHFLVPAVLLATYYNSTGQPEMKPRKIKAARERAEKVLGGFCGSHGSCGAAIGTGIFTSLVTGSTPLAKEEWRMSNHMTARALYSIAENGGPRCCKRDSYLAIQSAVEFSRLYLDAGMPLRATIHCEFSPLNRECRLEDCLFHAG